MAEFKWNAKRKEAVVRLVRGDADVEIAKALGTTVMSLWRWQQHPEFMAAVEAEGERVRAALRAEGIANKQNRIDAYNERWRLMREVIALRAEANAHRAKQWEETAESSAFDGYAAAGAETGLMVHTVTWLKDGRREEWAVDTGLLKELREHEKQAAHEIGDWTERQEVSGPNKGAIPVAIREVVVERPQPEA